MQCKDTTPRDSTHVIEEDRHEDLVGDSVIGTSAVHSKSKINCTFFSVFINARDQ